MAVVRTSAQLEILQGNGECLGILPATSSTQQYYIRIDSPRYTRDVKHKTLVALSWFTVSPSSTGNLVYNSGMMVCLVPPNRLNR